MAVREALSVAIRRALELFAPGRIARERDEEFDFHLQMEIDHNVRRGMSPDEARRAAVVSFGGRQRFREEVRDRRGVVVLDDVRRDARRALRRIRRAPAFAAGVIATLGIGIGAFVGIGSIVHRVLLSELPYPGGDRLVRVSFLTPASAVAGDLHSNATYVQMTGAQSFDGFAAFYTNDGVTITDDEPERATAAMVTPGTFAFLGAEPILGTVFAPADTASGGGGGGTIPVLISEELWESRYHRAPDIVGRTIAVNRGARRIIGVLPRSFDFPSPAVRIWYPLSLDLSSPSVTDRSYNVIGRLRAGADPVAAQAELEHRLALLPQRFPKITSEALRAMGARIGIESLKAWTVAGVRGQLVLLGIMVLVVLVIAATNVVNLFLLRTELASRETAIALSLGARASDVTRGFVVEGIVLALASTVLAMPIAAAILGTRLGFTPREIPRLQEASFGPAAVIAIPAAAIAVGLLVGIVASLRAMSGASNIDERLRGGRATESRAWRRTQRALVTAQIAFALALIAGASLLARSFDNLRKADLGFDPSGTMSFEVSLPYSGYASVVASSAFHGRLMDELLAIRGVDAVAAVSSLPLTETGLPVGSVQLQRADGVPGRSVPVGSALATPSYFAAMRIPVTEGRTFAPGDLAAASPAIVISRNVAHAMFGEDDPVGRLVRRVETSKRYAVTFRVVGVAGDVPGARIESGPAPMIYFPILRDGDALPADSFPIPFVARGGRYVVRGSVLPAAATLRRIVQGIDARAPTMDIRPLGDLVDAATARVRLTLLLLGVASAGALVLGVVGIYSVVAYAAAGRVREFGVRLALGAEPRRVAGLVMRDGAFMVAFGVAAGLAFALAGARLLQGLLYGVGPSSIAEVGAAVALVGAIALSATAVPAVRASRTDPAVVLRGD